MAKIINFRDHCPDNETENEYQKFNKFLVFQEEEEATSASADIIDKDDQIIGSTVVEDVAEDDIADDESTIRGETPKASSSPKKLFQNFSSFFDKYFE